MRLSTLVATTGSDSNQEIPGRRPKSARQVCWSERWPVRNWSRPCCPDSRLTGGWGLESRSTLHSIALCRSPDQPGSGVLVSRNLYAENRLRVFPRRSTARATAGRRLSVALHSAAHLISACTPPPTRDERFRGTCRPSAWLRGRVMMRNRRPDSLEQVKTEASALRREGVGRRTHYAFIRSAASTGLIQRELVRRLH